MPITVFTRSSQRLPGLASCSSIDKNTVAITAQQAREHRCLECGVTRVDPNRCIGCGICTTRCMFGAIRLRRDHSEFENYVPYEKAKLNTVINGVRQTVRLLARELVSKKD